MKVFRKYEFGSKSAATTKINALGEADDEGRLPHNHIIKRLGFITLDDDTLSPNYHVDVLWDGEPDSDWDNQLVWCNGLGVHHFGGSSAIHEFNREAKVQRPDLFPAPSDEE